MPRSVVFPGRLASALAVVLAVVLAVGLAVGLSASAKSLAAQTPDASPETPRLTLQAISTVQSIAEWPGVSLSVDRDAYVAVFAVTRGRVDFPFQVLSPTRPSGNGRLRAGKAVPVRQLGHRELLHLVSYGEAPVVVAFASTVKPDLSRFAIGKRWGPDLQIDSAAVDPRDVVDLLGMLVFGRNAEYDVVVSTVGDVVPPMHAADPFTFFDECRGFANQWTNRSGRDAGFYRPWHDIEPLERGMVNPVSYRPLSSSWMLGVPMIAPSGGRPNLMPSIQLGGGACTGVRVGGISRPPTSGPRPDSAAGSRPSGSGADSVRLAAPVDRTPMASSEAPVLQQPPKSPR